MSTASKAWRSIGLVGVVVLGIATMSVFVVVINRFFWRPLYYYAERRFRLA